VDWYYSIARFKGYPAALKQAAAVIRGDHNTQTPASKQA
jgi:hypothetical protein